LDDVEERKFLTLPGLELRPLGRPARSQSLYRLSYSGSCTELITMDNAQYIIKSRDFTQNTDTLYYCSVSVEWLSSLLRKLGGGVLILNPCPETGYPFKENEEDANFSRLKVYNRSS
jgi:hypothetical protein